MSSNLQSLFDKAVGGVLRQGCLSNGQGTCYYRHPGNADVRCAVGHLIPDELYSRDLEGVNIGAMRVTNVLVKAGVLPEPRLGREDPAWDLLTELQMQHDRAHTLDGFAKAAREVGNRHGLSLDIFEQVA